MSEAKRMCDTTALKADYSETLESESEFNVQSEWWESDKQQSEKHEIAERVPLGCYSVIDAGAGSGSMIPFLLRKVNGPVIAVDQCKRATSFMRRRFYDNPRVLVVEWDLRHFFAPVDVVICKAVLKHLHPVDRVVVLHNFCVMARRRVIFTMGIADQSGDRNPGAPYYDWAEPLDKIVSQIPGGWRLSETFDDPREPVFVCDRR